MSLAPPLAIACTMVRILFTTPDGQQRAVEAAPGRSLMEAAVMNNVPGILAECGGGCSCGTCHVYIDEGQAPQLPEPSAMEEALLDCVREAQPNSRLACQVKLTPAHEGLQVRVPPRQG